MINLGVHAAHCCSKHGCKYGEDAECPVVSGEINQEYPCEDCGFEKEPFEKIIEWLEFQIEIEKGIYKAYQIEEKEYPQIDYSDRFLCVNTRIHVYEKVIRKLNKLEK